MRRFVLCAAESGIDVFRMHDPLNDIDDLAVPAAAVREAGARLYAGLVYSDGPEGHDYLLEHARRLSDMGADRILLHDPAGALDPAGAGELIRQLIAAAGVPVGLYAQGPGGTALAVAIEAARAGADPIATASYPVAMLTTRPAAELLGQALTGLGFDAGLDREKAWEAARVIEAALGDAASSAPPVSPHVALRAALATVPIGVVAGIERSLRAAGAEDRLDEVLDELLLVRAESGYPPPASPVGTHPRRPGDPPRAACAPLDRGRGRHAQPAARRVGARAGAGGRGRAGRGPARAGLDGHRAVARGGARGGRQPRRLRGGSLPRRAVRRARPAAARAPARPRGRHRRRGQPRRRRGAARAPPRATARGIRRGRADGRGGRRAHHGAAPRVGPSQAPPLLAVQPAAAAAEPVAPVAPPSDTVLVESPMVGNFYRSSSPDADPFVQEGDRVEVGQTLCILEAMKLFNEFKSDHAGTVRKVLVDDAQPVEFGQPLFELAPL